MAQKMIKLRKNNEKGVGIVEVLMAIALLGVVAITYLVGNSAAYKAIFLATTRSTSQALAQMKMEEIKSPTRTAFVAGGTPPYENLGYLNCDTSHGFVRDYPGYTYSVDVATLLVGNPTGTEIQKITVYIKHSAGATPIVTLEDFKVNR